MSASDSFVDEYAALDIQGPVYDGDLIRKGYRQAALLKHTDTGGKDEEMQAVNAAWDLKDDDRRAIYNVTYLDHYKISRPSGERPSASSPSTGGPSTPAPLHQSSPYAQSFSGRSGFFSGDGQPGPSRSGFSSSANSTKRRSDNTPSGLSKRTRFGNSSFSGTFFHDANDDADFQPPGFERFGQGRSDSDDLEEIPCPPWFSPTKSKVSMQSSSKKSSKEYMKPLPNEEQLKEAFLESWEEILTTQFGVSEAEFLSIRGCLTAGGDTDLGRVVTRTVNALRDARTKKNKGKGKGKGKQL